MTDPRRRAPGPPRRLAPGVPRRGGGRRRRDRVRRARGRRRDRRRRAACPARRRPRPDARPRRPHVPVRGRAPGRDRHARAGPHVHGRVRPHDDVARRAGRPAPALDDDVGAAHGAGSPRARSAPTGGPGRRAARRHRRGARPAAGGPHDHHRVRAVAVRRTRRRAPADRFGLADRLPPGLVAAPALPGRRPRPGAQRRRPRASRPAPTTRRSRCTRSATSPGRPSARRASAGRSSASAGRRPRRPPRSRRATCMGFKDGTANIKAEETGRRRATRLGPARRRRGPGWLAGGTYMAVRRIRMLIETWDRTSLREQEAIIGRDQGRGRAAVGRDRVHRARLRRHRRRTAQPLMAADVARPARASVAARRRPDAAPGLQLHGRQRLARAARRRAVLRRVRARPADRLHPDPGRAGADRRA